MRRADKDALRQQCWEDDQAKGTAAREIITSWDDWIKQFRVNGVSWDEEDELCRNPVELRQ
jgi:hypothetical protein